MQTQQIRERNSVPLTDQWDLTALFSSTTEWEAALSALPELAQKITVCKGTLHESGGKLLAAVKALCAYEEAAEKVGHYASLLTAVNEEDSEAQAMYSRVMMTVTKCESENSFFVPEIQRIDDACLRLWLAEGSFADYRVMLTKILRMKPHVLGEEAERVLALQSESARAAHKAFTLLTNVDLDFGTVATGDVEVPLTQSTFSQFMENTDREIRKTAYTQFYAGFDAHKNTIAAMYEGSVNQDVFRARSRGYDSSRDMHLFPDNVSAAVYDNLVTSVRAHLAPLHRYYSIRKRLLNVAELRHYDVYVPLAAGVKKHTPYTVAVEILREALSPLGSDYTDVLCKGLTGGWVDRYENKGKRSGAFSSGSYTSYPYIMLNYKADVLRDVFTMAHEGGHSMHSWYSSRANPYPQYSYTIFEAEVASTFNEALLFEYYLKHATDAAERLYLVSMRIADVLATLYRQTMFAEFEARTHAMVEAGTSLTVDALRAAYRTLLQDYFGPDMVFEDESDLEGLRIPHFYNAFYVYKYATGISAALALADRITGGGTSERGDYFAFLKSGGSRYPIDNLKRAGVDMTTAAPVQAALDYFANLVDTLSNDDGS